MRNKTSNQYLKPNTYDCTKYKTKIIMKKHVSEIEKIDLILLCYEIKCQLKGFLKFAVKQAIEKKQYIEILKMMQENTPELTYRTLEKLDKIIIK